MCRFRRRRLADLARPRLGLDSLRPTASGVHVSSARNAVLGAIGLSPIPIKSARDGETSGRRDPQGANPCERN